MATIEDVLSAASVIPVLEVGSIEDAAPLAKSLEAGGLKVVELTLRTDCAIDAMKAMQDAAPDLIVGMGTIKTEQDVRDSVDNGAAFLVTPGAHTALLMALGESGAPALPGVATASEAMTTYAAGFSAMKFFPAEPAGGVSYLKALAGPLPEITFCPTGSISADRAPEYLALPNVACCGGSWIANKKMIAEGDWATIEKNAALAASMKN